MYIENPGSTDGVGAPLIPRSAARPARRHVPVRAALGQPKTAVAPKKQPTPQQTRWPCTATPPRCLTPAVSTGEFGRALLWFTDEHCVHASVPKLLAKSKTFMACVVVLDRRYLALQGQALCRHSTAGGDWMRDFAPNAGGVLTKGPFAGRRVLTTGSSRDGSLFSPAGSVDNAYPYDFIIIRLPDGIDPDGKHRTGGSTGSARVVSQWLAAIAHETVHAHNLVTATGAAPATSALRIAAALRDEAATRATEARILAEIAATTAGAFLKASIRGLTGSTAVWRIQRDFFPGSDRRTYLEHFVLNERMLDAIRREKLKPADVERIDKEVDAIDLKHRPLDRNLTDPFPIYYDPGVPAGKAGGSGISTKALFKTIATDYGKFRFWLRVIDARWKALEARLGGMPAPGAAAREAVGQEHANAFFDGIVRYDAIPPTPKRP